MKSLISIIVIFCSLPAFGQADLSGIWATGDDNTIIEISDVDGQFTGKIKSSDNQKAKIGKVILKDLKQNGSKWMGRIFAARRGEWHDVEIKPNKDVLELKISVGFFSKSLEWKRQG
jgi:uncharacterized protein (DUF2147 family)